MSTNRKIFSKRHLRRKISDNVDKVKKQLLLKQTVSLTKSLVTFSENINSRSDSHDCALMNNTSSAITTVFSSGVSNDGILGNSTSISVEPCNSSLDEINETSSNATHTSVHEDTLQQAELFACVSYDEKPVGENLSSQNAVSVNDSVFLHNLKLWACTNNISHKCLNDLIVLIKPKFPFLKEDARSILRTPRVVKTYSLINGEMIYCGVESGLRKKIKQGFENYNLDNGGVCNIPLQVNVDGIPLFNSGAGEFWPILARSLTLKDNTPFAVAVFFGNGKPDPLDRYLENFIEECLFLFDHGFEYSGRRYTIKISFFSCDAPARAYLKQVMGHTSKSGCERCHAETKYMNKRHFYPVASSANAKTDGDFLDVEGNSYIKDTSPLLKLGIKPITQFVLDPMHLIYLGCMRRLLSFWLEGDRRFRLCRKAIVNIDNQNKRLREYICDDFPRKLRTFSFVKKWKATEYRFFLLYCGIVLLKKDMCTEIYTHFLLLHCATFILSNKNLLKKYLPEAKTALERFVNMCPNVYDDFFVVYNIHSLIHVVDDVKRYGPLDSFSCFPFENYLGKLKSKVRGRYLPLQQIHNRLKEIEDVHESMQHEEQNVHLFKHFGVFDIKENSFQCAKLQIGNFFLISTDRKNSNVCRKNNLYKIKSILFMDETYKCVANKYKYLTDFYDYPIKSSHLGIYFGKMSDETVVFNASEITSKYLSLPYKDGFVLMPVLHTLH